MVDHTLKAQMLARQGKVTELVSLVRKLNVGSPKEREEAQNLGMLIEMAYRNMETKNSANS